MAVNEWKIWVKLGFVKKQEPEKINVEQDLKQIENFISTAHLKISSIQKLIKEFRKIRTQGSNLKKRNIRGLKANLEAQIRIYDKILKLYEFFDIDEDISAVRVKKIAKSLRRDAEKLRINEKLLNKIKTDERWTYNW